MFVKNLLTLFLCVMTTFGALFAVQRALAQEPLVVALDRAWHPLSFLDQQGQPQGVLIDYWRLVGKKMQRDVEFRLVDWQESLELVRDGKAMVHGGLFQSDKRDAYLDFSSDVLPMSTRLFVSSTLNAKHINDLEDVVVGLTEGGYESDFVRENFPKIEQLLFNNNEKLVLAVLEGRVDAFVADYPVGMFYLHKYGSPEQFNVVQTLYSKQLKSAVAEGNSVLLADINTALQAITKDEKSNVTQKWIRTETVTPPWLWSLMLSTFVFLLVLGGFSYAFLLKRQVQQKTQALRNEMEASVRLREENTELVAELRKQKADLEKANIAKSKFLAAASHDLRQPLHALSLYTSVLDENIQYPKMRTVVDNINLSIKALENLFNALLDISRLDAGVLQANKMAFSLRQLFENLRNDGDPQAGEKGLTILWDVCDVCVHTDPELLEQILRNFISNAIRYTDVGEVRVSCTADDECVTINVADTGIGIDAHELDEIFSEFYQLQNPERDRSKGLGLGLAIVKRTAKLLGHEIGVQSELGKGSVFSICVDRAVEPSVVRSDNVLSVLENEGDTLLIAVVDDEHIVREGTAALLETWGCNVITASDEAELKTKLACASRVPDGLIVDYRLREGKTGLQLLHGIKEMYQRDIPALIVTGDIAADRLRDVEQSHIPVLHKPIDAAKLRAFLLQLPRGKNTPEMP